MSNVENTERRREAADNALRWARLDVRLAEKSGDAQRLDAAKKKLEEAYHKHGPYESELAW